MAVPKAAVDENNRAVFRENNVGAAGKVFPMEPEPVPHPVQKAADGQFRSGILPVDSRHDGAPLLAGENVGHFREFRSFSTQPATAEARSGGTALPICFAISILDPQKMKSSGNVWNRAASRWVIGRCCSGWR